MKTVSLARSKTGLLLLFCLLSNAVLLAQPAEKRIKVQVAPEHADWQYKPGEKVKFNVSVTKSNILFKDAEIRYELSEDMMPARKTDKATLKNGTITIDGGTMNTPGFLRCRVFASYDGKEYEGLATAGFDIGKIQPTTTLPEDFINFWDKAKAGLSGIPIDAIVALMPEQCTAKVNVYHVSLRNIEDSRVYGILCTPKAPGKYPALLSVPGAGIRPYYGDKSTAEKGYITLQIGIHGVPVNLPAQVYTDMSRGPLRDYHAIQMEYKDRYYYKRVYLGCVRAIDYIFSLPEFDGSNLAVCGGSQGGALSIVTAGLDERVKCIAAFYPAMSDMGGYLYGRAGGWPHSFRGNDKNDPLVKARLETARYYDVVNFARQLKSPGFYSLGFNDMVCPPTSMYSAYNVITAPKELLVVEEIGHWTYPEQWTKAYDWMFKQLDR